MLYSVTQAYLKKSVKMSPMLQRAFIHLSLILVFAFTQIGVATHEISHLTNPPKHSQQDKSTPAEQCGQCISYAKVANGLALSTFQISSFSVVFTANTPYFVSFQPLLNAAYAARAPPQITSI